MTTLVNKTMRSMAMWLLAILLFCAPLFYFLTTRFYAEDLIDVVEDYRRTGRINDNLDLERDVTEGLMLQYLLITLVIGGAMLFSGRIINKRVWKPFNRTLRLIEQFCLGRDEVPEFPLTEVREFKRLNSSVAGLLERNNNSYRVQQEFTQNASHELQTPLAVLKADLDLFLQENLDEEQARIVDSMYQVVGRLEHLNRSLLLLAGIENDQYLDTEPISLADFIRSRLSEYGKLYPGPIHFTVESGIHIQANSTLVGVLVNNLVVNALRNVAEGSAVSINLDARSLSVVNPSEQPELDKRFLFSRFNNPTRNNRGNGLGLAIVKQICDYYDWTVGYTWVGGCHTFTVSFN